ncbi:hypothetical protein J4208_05590 [Candidatus Woesearchaeota archaeon]|nr:hypothetical protein [Candidatus Woesearchaeota archaeon]
MRSDQLLAEMQKLEQRAGSCPLTHENRGQLVTDLDRMWEELEKASGIQALSDDYRAAHGIYLRLKLIYR